MVAPAQYGPPFNAVGVDGLPTGTDVELLARQPEPATTDSVSPTLPLAAAVYVAVCAVAPAVMVPFVIPQAYDDMPAGPEAVLPVELGHTGDCAGVMVAVVPLQSVSA